MRGLVSVEGKTSKTALILLVWCFVIAAHYVADICGAPVKPIDVDVAAKLLGILGAVYAGANLPAKLRASKRADKGE